jgi:hypothetical protein
MARILFVLTGASYWTLKDDHRHPTGYWAEEFVAPYSAFTEAGRRSPHHPLDDHPADPQSQSKPTPDQETG